MEPSERETSAPAIAPAHDVAEHDEPLTREDFEALARFRFGIRRYLRFSEETVRSHGITPQHYQLMLAIKGFPGREWAVVRELAERLQLRHHSVVELVDRAAAQGLVHRAADPDDARAVRVPLTVHGELLLARLSALHRDELRRMDDVLTLPRWHAQAGHLPSPAGGRTTARPRRRRVTAAVARARRAEPGRQGTRRPSWALDVEHEEHPMRGTSAARGTHDDWTFSETIDEDHSAITVSGRVDRLGVDLLRGTIEELRRRGHRNITVTFEHPDTVDAFANDVLIEVAEWLIGLDGHLLVRWSAGEHGGRSRPRRTVPASTLATPSRPS